MYVRPEIAAMDGYMPGEQPQAGKFIKLNTNENPYPLLAGGAAGDRDGDRAWACRSIPIRWPMRFARGPAKCLACRADWILCGNGSDDILTIVHAGVRRPGRAAAAAVSQLHPLPDAGAACRAPVPRRCIFNADWTLGDDFAAARPRLKLAFLPNPNSPSGTMFRRERVLELAERLPCPLLVDEAYVDFADANCLRPGASRTRRSWSRAR